MAILPIGYRIRMENLRVECGDDNKDIKRKLT